MSLNNALDDLYADGFTADSVVQAAAAVAELVRYLNHATIADASVTLPYPSTVASVLGDLRTATQRLPQLLHRAADHLDRIADDTAVVDASLTDAIHAAGALTDALDAAFQAANWIPARTG